MTEDKIKDIQAMIQIVSPWRTVRKVLRLVGNLIWVLNEFSHATDQEVLGQEHRTGESTKMAEAIIELTLNAIRNYREGLRQIISQAPDTFFNAINNDRLIDLLKKADIDKDIIH